MHDLNLLPRALVAASIVMTACASPAPSMTELAPRAAITEFCGQNDLVHASDFLLYNNLWGEDEATSGSQCTYLDYDSGNIISWVTTWNWTGDSGDVKSYSNAVPSWDATQLSTISSIPSNWSWSLTGTDVIADVSYDAFISSSDSTTANHTYEVMVWLAKAGGAVPLGYSDGIIDTVTISGISWDLYQGSNGWTVYSFTTADAQNEFSGDINEFFTYLIDNQGVSSSYYLQTVGAGVEAFTGSKAYFTVSPYSISLEV